MAIIRVGVNKDYVKITDALTASVDGDIILIDPGDYTSEGSIAINKAVSLVGDTKDVINNKILLYRLVFSNYQTTKYVKIVVENLYIWFNRRTYYVINTTSTWSANAEVIFNKCYIVPYDPNSYPIISWQSHCFFTFINCFLSNQGVSGVDAFNKMATVRCRIGNENYVVNIKYQDYVFSDVIGYGVDYGYSYVKLPTKYYFQGKVTEQGNPVSRSIFAFRRDNDVLLSVSTSDSVTGEYKLITEYDGEHYLVCKDDSAGEVYNDLIRARVVPAIGDYEENVWTSSSKFFITIDHTSVDSELYDFPLVVKIDTSVGTTGFDNSTVFNDLSLFNYAMRWSIQTSDNSQLYAEIMEWDVTNRKAIIWVQVPYISSDVDTKLTFYYNHLLPSNLYNVGYSNNILVSHVWGPHVVGIWHMNEDPGEVNDIKDSSYRRNHATPYNLGSNQSKQYFLNKSLDLSNGYLKISSTVHDDYADDMTLLAFVKFDNIFDRSTIFCLGDSEFGWEVGIDNTYLFSHISSDINRETIQYTLSGINLNEWYLVSASVDSTNHNMYMYLNDIPVASGFFEIGNFRSNNYSNTIGTSYLNSPYEGYREDGVGSFINHPISTVSGTVVSGTVLFVIADDVNYYDSTGRHTLIPKLPDDVSIVKDKKRIGVASIRHNVGPLVDDGINDRNYITISDNESDFSFDGDFTITSWVYPYIYATYQHSSYVSVFGDTNGLMDRCMSLQLDRYYVRYHGYYSSYNLTIPNDSGGYFVHNQFLCYRSNRTWDHIALVRYNGIVTFYLNGIAKYSVFADGLIPATVSGSVFGMSSFYNRYGDSYILTNHLEIIKGYARWTSDFSIATSPKNNVDTFFSGQIGEVMLYKEVKDLNYISVFNKNIRDNLSSYS